MYDTNSTMARKNPVGALDAYKKAFPVEDEHVGLVIKMNNPKQEEMCIRDRTVILAFVWLVLPILTGCLFGLFPQREYRKRRSAYLIGSLTIWALFYGLARIALDGKWTLTKLTKVFCVLLAVLTILSTGDVYKRQVWEGADQRLVLDS